VIHPEVKMEEGADFSDRFKEKESMEWIGKIY
jgi:hypothetical protein